MGIEVLYVKLEFFLSQNTSRPFLKIPGTWEDLDEGEFICFYYDGSWSVEVRDVGWGFLAKAEGLVLMTGAGWQKDNSSCHYVEGLVLLKNFKDDARRRWSKVIFKIDSMVVFRAALLGQWCESPFSSWLPACWIFSRAGK